MTTAPFLRRLGLLLQFSAHHFRNNGQHLVVATAAAGGTMGCVFHLVENRQKPVQIAMFLCSVQNIKIGYVVALAHHVVLGSLGV